MKAKKAYIESDEVLNGLCCTNRARDSSCESSVVAGVHEQTYPPNLQGQELALLQSFGC